MNYRCPVCGAKSEAVALRFGDDEHLNVLVGGPQLRVAAIMERPMLCAGGHRWRDTRRTTRWPKHLTP